jgi:serine/threonine-protein kinase HipA
LRVPAAAFWRRIALFILISNTDDHLRNHALLHDRNETWSLSPAFDLNPNPDRGPKHLSTAINDDARADLRDLMDTADLFRLTREQAQKILGEVDVSVRRWPQVAARNGLSKAAITKMAPAFAHQQADIAQQLTT